MLKKQEAEERLKSKKFKVDSKSKKDFNNYVRNRYILFHQRFHCVFELINFAFDQRKKKATSNRQEGAGN